MKNRLALVDILAEVRDLQRLLLRSRLQNVYSLDEKTFLLRFGAPGCEKQSLLIESGIRLHCTRYARGKPALPSAFAMKLRKHIRGKRLVAVAAAGSDRVVCFTFGSPPAQYHLIVEACVTLSRRGQGTTRGLLPLTSDL